MRTISSAFRNKLYKDDYRDYLERVTITFADGNTQQIVLDRSELWGGGIEIDDAVSADNVLDIGSAIIGSCVITIENLDERYSQYEFLKAKVVPEVGLQITDGEEPTYEYTKLGEYYVEDESFDATCVKLTCYDAMAKFDKLISESTLDYGENGQTLSDIISDASTVCGVPFDSSTLDYGSYVVLEKPDKTSTTFRELISWAGQISGQNARINVDGTLEYVWYDKDALSAILAKPSSPSNAIGLYGENLVINTFSPNAQTASRYPKLIGQGVNTAGRGSATVAEHGIRFTVDRTAANMWPYIRFGTSTIADADMLGLNAGDTYTLSADLTFRVLSGSPSSSTEYYLATRIYDNNNSASSFSQANSNDPNRIIHTFSTDNLTDRNAEVEARLEYTFTVRPNATAMYIDIARVNDNDPALYTAHVDFIEARNIKVERGSIASAWSPAYDDLTNSSYHTVVSTFGAPSVSLNDVEVTQVAVGIKVQNSETGSEEIARYATGNSGYTVAIENNGLIQGAQAAETVMAYLYGKLHGVNPHGFTFRKASFSCLSDPSIEAGDIVQLIDRKGNIYACLVSGTKFKVGSQQTVRSSASDPERTSVNRSSQSIKNYVGAMKLLAEERKDRANADTALLSTVLSSVAAQYASFGYLEANYMTSDAISANYLDADEIAADYIAVDDADIANLKAGYIEAIDVDVGTLNGDFANLVNLIAGTQTVGSLNAITLTGDNVLFGDGFFDTLVADHAAIQNLDSNIINTNNIKIISGTDENTAELKLTGKFLQFKDANGTVRIQIGRDGNNSYSLSIYDANGDPLWYNDGITGGAVPDGLITDAMVSESDSEEGYNGISASKLNINSVRSAVIGEGISSTSIILDDENQNLTQVYRTLNSHIDAANGIAQTASDNADRAIRALDGITSLDNLTAILSNDAHVVHTMADGSDGDFTFASTKVTAFKGDSDITNQCQIVVQASAGVTGTWDSVTHTYQVTGLSTDNGTVDFGVAYAVGTGRLAMSDGSVLVLPDDVYLGMPIAATITKRFSISKSKDGLVGVTYRLVSSAQVIRRNLDNTLEPSSITFSAQSSDGTGLKNYSGKFLIETSQNGTSWNEAYSSQNAEVSVTYTPLYTVRFIRATLMNEDDVVLDRQNVVVITDSDQLLEEIDDVRESVQTNSTKIGTIETGIEEIRGELLDTKSELYGLSDGTLLFQTPYVISGDLATFTAKVYKAGVDIANTFPSHWFSWYKRTELGDEKLGEGLTMTVSRSSMGYGGVVIGRFETFDEGELVLPDGNALVMPDEKTLLMYATN